MKISRSVVIAAALLAVLLAPLASASVQQVVSSIVATTCTNQFVRSIASTGGGTCATVSLTADVTGITPPANGGTGVANSANTTVTSATSIGQGQYLGTATNDSATAGNVGQRLDFTANANTVSITSNSGKTIISGSLTAGDWEVTCTIFYRPTTSTTVATLYAELSATDNLITNTPGKFANVNYPSTTVLGATAQDSTVVTPPSRVSVASPTTYYCVGYVIIGVSTMAAGANMHAVRVR